jgi:hypothetical protein
MLKNVASVVMSHVRDVNIIHAIDKRVFITIPLYFEKGFIFQSARVENGELIVKGVLPKLNVSEPASHSELS